MKKKLLSCVVFGCLIGSAMSCSNSEGMDFTLAYRVKDEDSNGVRAIKAAAKAFKYVDEKAADTSVYFESTTGKIRLVTWLSVYKGDERDAGAVFNTLRNRGLEGTARFLNAEKSTLEVMRSERFGRSMAEQWDREFFPRFEECLAYDITVARSSFAERRQRLEELHGRIDELFGARSKLLADIAGKTAEYLDLAKAVPVAADDKTRVQRELAEKSAALAKKERRLQEISGQAGGDPVSQDVGTGLVLWTPGPSQEADHEKLTLIAEVSSLKTEIDALKRRLESVAKESAVEKGRYAQAGEELAALRGGLLGLNRELYGLSEQVFDLTAPWNGMTEELQALIGKNSAVTPASEIVAEIGRLYESLFEGIE